MNANLENFLDRIDQLDTRSHQHFPNSRKIYVEGSRPDLKVPMREIALTSTETEHGIERNPPIRVYDSSEFIPMPVQRSICALGSHLLGLLGSLNEGTRNNLSR